MSKQWATRLALPTLPMVILEHPLAQLPAAEIEARGEAAVDRVIAAFTENIAT
jgi:hypothetical protein